MVVIRLRTLQVPKFYYNIRYEISLHYFFFLQYVKLIILLVDTLRLAAYLHYKIVFFCLLRMSTHFCLVLVTSSRIIGINVLRLENKLTVRTKSLIRLTQRTKAHNFLEAFRFMTMPVSTLPLQHKVWNFGSLLFPTLCHATPFSNTCSMHYSLCFIEVPTLVNILLFSKFHTSQKHSTHSAMRSITCASGVQD
jgi:hypothetical protein